MKKQKFQDERVLTQRRKIGNEALTILLIVLFGSVLVQHYFLNAPFEQYAVEFISFAGISILAILKLVNC